MSFSQAFIPLELLNAKYELLGIRLIQEHPIRNHHYLNKMHEPTGIPNLHPYKMSAVNRIPFCSLEHKSRNCLPKQVLSQLVAWQVLSTLVQSALIALFSLLSVTALTAPLPQSTTHKDKIVSNSLSDNTTGNNKRT